MCVCLAQAVEGADEHFVLQDAAECEIEQDEGCKGKGCCPMWTVKIHSRLEQIQADNAISYVPEHQQYHAKRGYSHLQSPVLEEPDVDEDQSCSNDQNAHQDWAEVEHMLALRDEPEVIHIHLFIAVKEAIHNACSVVANHKMGYRQAETSQAEGKGQKQVNGL